MKKMTKNILTMLLSVSFLIAPTVYAQETPDASSTPSVDATAAPAADTTTADASAAPATPDVQSVNPQDGSTTLQDTSGTQPAATGNVLENTGDPTATSTLDSGSLIPLIDTDPATTTDPTPVVDATTTATTTPVDPAPTTVDVAATIDTTVPPTDDTPPPVAIELPQVVAQPIATVDAPVAPKYDFALTGKTVATKKKIKDANGDVTGETSVGATLTPVVDNTTNTVSVSGQCSDKFFVVLLYKDATDYDNDPGSYLLNKAFPCDNNSFSYAISDLPSTLPNGTYYLLVGQEGDRGTWSPITNLSEITINRTQ